MTSPFSYTFACDALAGLVAGKAVKVIHWQGTEAISSPYRFVITLAVQETDVPLEQLLNMPATLSGYRPDGRPLYWHGIITQGTQQGGDETYDYYQVVLEPRLARLRNIRWSDIYLNQQLDDLIRQLLRLANLEEPYRSADTPYDYRIVASQLASTRTAFTCQFEESCLDFLMRKLECYGVYFWFEQGPDQESVIFANKVEQQPVDTDSVVYYPKGVIDPDAREIAVIRLNRCVSLQPNSMTLHSANDFSNTTLSLISQHDVPAPVTGFGEVHSAEDYFETLNAEGNVAGSDFATWRSEELACQRLRIEGEARAPGVCAGRTITVSEYLRGNQPTDYYVIAVTHEGTQALETAPETSTPAYRAQFVALPRWLDGTDARQPLQFRPPRVTPVPVISRLVNGFVDIDTPNQPKKFAQTDEYGRYRVRLMFPHQRYSGYQNSAWLRMATPYAGGTPASGLSNAGMHFPLREGTEVVVGFLNGNPDRPVILAALPNVEAPSVVSASNPADHVIRTPSGNMLALRDSDSSGSGNGNSEHSGDSNNPDYVQENTASVVVSSSACESSLTLGKAPSDSESADGFILSTASNGTIQAEQSMLIEVPGHMHIAAGSKTALDSYLSSEIPGLPKGISAGTTGGLVIEHFLGAKISATEAIDISSFMGLKVDAMAAMEFCVKAAGSLEICYAGKKELNLREKEEVTTKLTTIGEKASFTFGDWDLTAMSKTETVNTSTVKAATRYKVATLGEYVASAGGGASSVTLVGSSAALLGSDTAITGATGLSLEGGIVEIAAGEDLSMTANAVTVEAMSIDLSSAAGINLNAASEISCIAVLIQLG